MRPRMIMTLALASLVTGGVLLAPAVLAQLGTDSRARTEVTGSMGSAPDAPSYARKASEPAPPLPPTLSPGPVKVQIDKGFFSWALLDRKSGKISGAPNLNATNSTESMIKIWIVSDYLRELGNKEPSAEQLRIATVAIINSDDDAAQILFEAGHGKPVIDRLVKLCGLTDTRAVVPPGRKTVWWSYTKISAQDAVRMGECVKNGTAAGPRWTEWILDTMTKVQGSTAAKDQQAKRGGGRWGIIDGLPREITDQGRIGIKNGWTKISADQSWHLNCLAVADDWVLAVLLRYPQHLGLDYGADICASVAAQLVTPQPGAALKVPLPEREPAVRRPGPSGAPA
ncbi:serine hydrolase [Micromonospora sp. NPDC050417]|uniref:serine hydrolase n=1 Tax=Micromonospora sp. NPDC050417 TaxID=3364280 RepID=UPI0037BB7ADA